MALSGQGTHQIAMNPLIVIRRHMWLHALILLWATHAAGWCQEGPSEDDPLRKMEIWAHGIYDNPGKAERTITPEFLRSLDVQDRYFVDAMRMYVGTDQLAGMSGMELSQVIPVGRIITGEIRRRGDEVIPVFIALMQEPPNPYCPLANQILIYLQSMKSLDMQPVLYYVREYLREHPDDIQM